MKISIITVCYNCQDALKATFNSALEQSFDDFEYIVIDGSSCDDSVIVIEQFAQKFKSRGVDFFWLSEPDNGIYDAMNKGARFARGQWVVYMNAGDTFYSSDILSLVSRHTNCDAGVVYGDVWRETKRGGSLVLANKPLRDLSKRMIFCHQSSFVKLDLLLGHPFSLDYRIASDFNFFRTLYLDGVGMFYMSGLTIACYDAVGGLSSRNKMLLSHEVYRIVTGRRDYLWFFKHILVQFRNFLYQL